MKRILFTVKNLVREYCRYVRNIGIESNCKEICNFYFEQNVSNELEREQNYFNQPCIEVPIIDDNKAIVAEIINNMRKSIQVCGMGLAHNQYPQQKSATNPYAIFIIQDHDISFEAFINPVIAGHTTEKIGYYHGCLSQLGHNQAKMASYKEILLVFRNQDFHVQIKKYTNLTSVICQHEFNHLTTKGTYVDAVRYHVRQHPGSDEKSFYSTAKQMESDKHRFLFAPVGEDIPCLTLDYVLSKCPPYIKSHEEYEQAVQHYLKEHSEDQLLYDNLISHPQQEDTFPLYGEVSYKRV